MKPPRQKTAVRLKEARERIDAFEAQTEPPPPFYKNPKVGLIFWTCVIVVGLAIYFFAAWMQRR